MVTRYVAHTVLDHPAALTTRRRRLARRAGALIALGIAAAPAAAHAYPAGYPGSPVSPHVNGEPTLLSEDWDLLKFDRNNGKDTSNNDFPGFTVDTDRDTILGDYPCRHVQKTLRLPQRAGYGNRTYFVGTVSENNGGWMYLIETYPGVFGSDGESAVPDTTKLSGGFAGKVVWYKRTDNANFGSWGGGCNHPGNMTVHPNGTLAMACQNWDKAEAACTVDQVKVNGVPVHDTAVFFSVVNAHTAARLEYVGHWDVPAELGVSDYKLKTVGLAKSGSYTHVWVAGDNYVKHYRAPGDFTPVSSPDFDVATDLTALAGDSGSPGMFDGGTVDISYAGSSGGELQLADMQSVESSDSVCIGVEIAGHCAGARIRYYDVRHRMRMQKVQYLDAAGTASSTMTSLTTKVKGGSSSVTNYVRGTHDRFETCDGSVNPDCPSRYYWCSATSGYYVSSGGQGALYCFDEEVDQGAAGQGLRMRSYAYNTRISIDTGSGDGQGTDSPIEAKLDFPTRSFDWFEVDSGVIDDFETGSHRAYVVPDLPLAGHGDLTGVKLRSRGGDRFRPAKVSVHRNGATLVSWTNGTPALDLDADCGTDVGTGCVSSFLIPANGSTQPLTDYIGVKAETYTSSGSGTDAPIYFSFKTERSGWSSWFRLDNTLDNFNAGKLDYFVVNVGQPVAGAIEAVKIKSTGDDIWRPKSIAIDRTISPSVPASSWTYDFNWTETDGSVSVASDCDDVLDSTDKCASTFVLLPNNTHHLSDWEIWFHTRNVAYADTDGAVTFQVGLDTGKFSAVGDIDDAADNLEKNRWDAAPITGLTDAEDTSLPLKVWLNNPSSDGWQPDEVLIKHYGTTVWRWTKPSAFADVWVDADGATPTSPTDGIAKSLVLIDNGGSSQDGFDSVISLQHDMWVQLQTATDTSAGTNTEIVLAAQFESGLVVDPLLIVDETPANLELGTTQKYNLRLPTDQGKITKLVARAKGNDGWAPQGIQVHAKGPGTLFNWTRSQATWIDGDAETPDVFLDDAKASAGVLLNNDLASSSPTGYLEEVSTFGYDEYTIETHTATATDSQTNTPVYFQVKFASGATPENTITSSLEGVLEQDSTDMFGIHHIPMSNNPGGVLRVMFRAGGNDGWQPDSVIIRRHGTVIWEWTRPASYSEVFVDGDAPTATVATDDGRASSVVLIDNGGSSPDGIASASSW